jgi:hypothetical protein
MIHKVLAFGAAAPLRFETGVGRDLIMPVSNLQAENTCSTGNFGEILQKGFINCGGPRVHDPLCWQGYSQLSAECRSI